MGDFNGHHTLWGCQDVNNRGQQLEDLILKNYFWFCQWNLHFHRSNPLQSISFSRFILESWSRPLCQWPPSLERVQRWKVAKANWDKSQHLCSTRLHQSAIADADDPMSLFTSILKDIAEETIPKTSMEELQDALRRAHNTPAGPDEIHYQLLKHLPGASLLLLLNIFNKI